MLKSFFPPIDISTVKTDNIKRVVLFYLNAKKDTIEFRHFTIRSEFSGINKRIRGLINCKKLPNLRDYDDISDYILRDLEFKQTAGGLNTSMDSEITI
jgi:ribosome biogenesis protein SSF1/2